jgi:FtsH-binding integral membrane protein
VSFGRYAALVAVVVTVSLGGLWPVLAARNRTAAVVGALLAAVNTLGAYGLVLWASGRSTNAFMGAVLGGMVGRMGLMLAAVVVAVLFLGLPKVPLAVSLLGYFVVFLVFELTVLQRRTSGPEARRS